MTASRVLVAGGAAASAAFLGGWLLGSTTAEMWCFAIIFWIIFWITVLTTPNQ